MKIKAGSYTLAVTMIASGIMMLLNTLNGNDIFRNLWIYSPSVLILFGLEIIILNLAYMNKENYRVEVSSGSVVFIIVVIVIFMLGTSRTEIRNRMFDNFF